MGKLIAISGGTKGIGKAIAHWFAAAGDFELVTCSRNSENIKQFSWEFEKRFPAVPFEVVQADLSVSEGVEKFSQAVKSRNKPLEVLVNNSGVFRPGSVLSEEKGTFEYLMNTNLASAYHLCRELVPLMEARKRGIVFTICSTASIIPYVNGGSYCISKFALLGMTKVLREELKKSGVRVTAVIPGATLTDSWAGSDQPPERFIKPEDIAQAVYTAYTLSETSVMEEILIRPQLGDI